MKPLLTVKQAAERLDKSVSYVYQLLGNGSIEHYELGRGINKSRRISEEQLSAYMEQQQDKEPVQ